MLLPYNSLTKGFALSTWQQIEGSSSTQVTAPVEDVIVPFNLYLFIFMFAMCACVHACVCMFMHSAWRLEIGIGHFLQLLSTLLFETWFIVELGAQPFVPAGRPASSGVHVSLLPQCWNCRPLLWSLHRTGGQNTALHFCMATPLQMEPSPPCHYPEVPEVSLVSFRYLTSWVWLIPCFCLTSEKLCLQTLGIAFGLLKLGANRKKMQSKEGKLNYRIMLTFSSNINV